MRPIILFTLTLFIVCSIGCKKDEVPNNTSTPVTLNNSFSKSLLDRIQYFTFNANSGFVCQSSFNGVDVCLNTDCLELNGNPVNGEITLEFIEIFDRGSMITTNKPTMGVWDGEYNMLKSGGEFYMQAYQNGVELTFSSNCWWSELGQLGVPSSLTGGMDNEMTAWSGSFNTNGDIIWEPMSVGLGQEGGLQPVNVSLNDFGVVPAATYVLPFTNGWSNCDVFYSWPTPKTTVSVNVPDNYDGDNALVFITYGADDNTTASLPYSSIDESFNTYVNSISVGMEAHFIFLLQYGDGSFRYAIETVIVQENEMIEFLESDLIEATSNQLEAAINALP